MNVVAQVAAGIAAAVHVLIFVMESVAFRRPTVHRRFGTAASALDAVRPWALNQGFYNLFLALGTITGLILLAAGRDAAGTALVVFTCAAMLGAALVLIASNRRMARGALIQGAAPAVALLAALL